MELFYREIAQGLDAYQVGQVLLFEDNPYANAKPVSGTVKFEGDNRYACIMYEVKLAEADADPACAVGIDRNVGQIALSDGTIYRLPDTARLEARKRRCQ